MAAVNKIDSNVVSLAYAEEASIGVLSSPTWYQLNPNSYDDFGGEITTVSANPINPSRQRNKGVTTDLDASGGFNHNWNFYALLDLFQGAFFADTRQKGTEEVTAVDVDSTNPDEYEVASTTGFLVGNIIKGFGFANSANNAINVVTAVTADTSVEVADGQLVDETVSGAPIIKVVGHQFAGDDLNIVVSGDLPVITSDASFDFTTIGLVAGQWIYIGGDSAATQFSASSGANNGYKRIRSVSDTEIVLDKSETTMVAESLSGGETIQIFYGDVIKNETGTSIVRRTYHFERLLGAPDDGSTDVQSEVLTGTVINEVTFNIPQADLASIDFTLVATDAVQYTAGNELQSSVQEFYTATDYNTSSDVRRIRMALISDTDEDPNALFAYVTEAELTINNNVSPNKAVGVLGAFDVTAGTFEVGGSVTAYFASVAATQAVRNNSSATIDVMMIKDNQGMILDLPLISLGNGRLEVEQDEPITLPLEMNAARGRDVATTLDHTFLITEFWYLPTAAM